MENSKVLVIDPDPKNLQILKETLEASSYDVVTSGNGEEAWRMLQMNKPDIIISEVDTPRLNGFQLLEKLQRDPVLSSIPLVFLTNRRNLEDRIKSLQTGVKDYMIKPLHVKEVIARIEMILRRIDRLKNEETESSRKAVGRLEEQSVESLLENYGVEKKSGVLSIYDNHNRNGEIYFREGAVINARLGNFRAEKAVYQMLPWDKGHFIMTFKEVNVADEITVSNLGLLLQGHRRMQERNSLLKQLPSLDTIFNKTELFQKILKRKPVGEDAASFINLFDGERTLSEIISESTYDELKALERIVRMYQQGFIKGADQDGKVVLPAEPEKAVKLEETPSVREKSEPKTEINHEPEPEPTEFNKPKANGKIETEEPEFPEFNNEEFPPFTFPEKEKAKPNGSIFKGIEKDEEIEDTFGVKEETEQNKPVKNGLDAPFHGFESKEESSTEKNPGNDDDKNSTLEDIWKAPDKLMNEKVSTSTEPEVPEKTMFEENPSGEPIGTGFKISRLPEGTDKNAMLELLDNLFGQREGSNGKLVVLCGNNKYRTDFISTFTDGKFIQKNIGGKKDLLEIGKVTTTRKRELEVLGISPERKFLQVLDEVEPSLLAYVVLIVGDTTNSLSYLGYLIKSLETKFNVPHVMAVHRPADKKKIPLDFIRYSLKLEEDDQIVDVSVDDVDSIKHLLNQLIPPKKYTSSPGQKSVDDYSLKT